MQTRKRLTREASKEVTRERLIEAAEGLFIQKGFEETSVADISEAAGYSRGAFYSNFDNKEQLFLAVIDRSRPKALGDFSQQGCESVERIAAARDWYANQWRFKNFITLGLEFTRRAMRDRSVQEHLAQIRRRELETYATSVGQHLAATHGKAADRPEVVALVLLAVAHGLGSLAIHPEPEWQCLYTEAAKLVFDRMMATENFH